MSIYTVLAALLVLSITTTECYPRGRILGGKESAGRPYMVSLQLDGVHFCGGLLISDEWILSAAHCMPAGNKTLHVMLGESSLKQTANSKTRVEFEIKKYFVHPLYNSSLIAHDLLLLKLPNKVNVSDAIKPMPFQKEDVDIPEGTRCLVSGWGQIRLTGKRPDTLNEVLVTVISRDQCNRRDYYDNELTDNMMCAGEKGKDSCEGDSGGPLICNSVAVGIVSFGSRKCGNAKRPGIYTRIVRYNNWINSTMHNATLQTTTTSPIKL
ncbi:complement factor D [Pelobates cultripes]|uniref:Complement factor D n=1 Tax=Pelobates cultripes TaxID=61616 RepID=A0AAD1S7I6_PELCU|nr:complement factor D [Pelobates cultripes]